MYIYVTLHHTSLATIAAAASTVCLSSSSHKEGRRLDALDLLS